MNVILGMGRIEFYTTESGLVGFLDKEGRKLDFSMYFWIKLVTTINRSPPSAGRST